MTFDPRNYPPTWKTEIRPAVLARAGNRCEQCGVANGARGMRDRAGVWQDDAHIQHAAAYLGVDVLDGLPYKPITIVLTVAHLETAYGTMDGRLEVLQALCQKCHLDLDRPLHQRTRRSNRDRARGQLRLPGVP